MLMLQNSPFNKPPPSLCGVSLRMWNGITACIHFLNAVTILSLTLNTGQDLIYKITASYADWAPTQDNPNIERTVITGERFSISKKDIQAHELSLAYLIFFFFMLSFLFQAVAGFFPQLYPFDELLSKGQHPLRFIEYSISAPLMLIAISLLCGVFDLYALIGIGVLCSVCQMFGLLAEYLAAIPKVKEKAGDEETALLKRIETQQETINMYVWIAHIAGWICILGSWIPIFASFLVSNSQSETKAPEFVYAIVISMFIMFNLFGFNQLFELSGFYSHEQAEVTYIMLSLIAKTLLGWMIFANVLAPM